MKANAKSEPQSLVFGFAEEGKVTMCSYVPKKNKSVILLSTMHSDESVNGAKNKLEIIQYYNSTKGGVDNPPNLLLGSWKKPGNAFHRIQITNAPCSKNIFNETCIESMLGHPIVRAPPTSTSAVHSQGTKGRKPVVGSCYICRFDS
ncbi:hypothetical protein ILUMI_12279 [Ignelater luminosus]|uniref:PiggyBac transposable element-derived protein domain-containing protein n=1 Tax=Ignelater luminosus TaxID=2038154 RepID=A0A8K0G6X6_IGNLU|nr:hypothetical protein ILUMI_12279 [Ignelater luminosus]